MQRANVGQCTMKRILRAACIFLIGLAAGAAPAEVLPADPLQTLLDGDRAIFNNATVRLELARADSLQSASPGTAIVRYTHTYVFGDEVSVCISRRSPLAKGRTLDPFSVRKDRDAIGIASGIVEVLSAETWTRAVSFDWVRYDAAGRILEIVPGPATEVDIRPADSPAARAGFYRPFLALGRGYSLFVDEMGEASDAGDSIILNATGSALASGRRVSCRLVLDPLHPGLVRRGRFEEQATVTANTARLEATARLPLYGHGLLSTAGGATAVTLLAFEEGILQELIDEALQAIENLPEGTLVFDHRTPRANGNSAARVIGIDGD